MACSLRLWQLHLEIVRIQVEARRERDVGEMPSRMQHAFANIDPNPCWPRSGLNCVALIKFNFNAAYH